jgi:hypothetical protein
MLKQSCKTVLTLEFRASIVPFFKRSKTKRKTLQDARSYVGTICIKADGSDISWDQTGLPNHEGREISENIDELQQEIQHSGAKKDSNSKRVNSCS